MLRILIFTLLLSACASTNRVPVAIDRLALEEQVADTERAFAATMAARDFAAFGSFLAEDTVFFNGDTPIRGKQAVLDAWQKLYEKPEPPFSWHPTSVQVLDAGDLAISRGPVFVADGSQVGNFNSIWRRQADGSWKIIFDHGSDHCPPPAAK